MVKSLGEDKIQVSYAVLLLIIQLLLLKKILVMQGSERAIDPLSV